MLLLKPFGLLDSFTWCAVCSYYDGCLICVAIMTENSLRNRRFIIISTCFSKQCEDGHSTLVNND